MKTEKKNFERELPKGYREVFHINAKDKGTALWLSVGAFLITAVVFVLLLIPVFRSGVDISDVSPAEFFIFYGVFVLSMIGYVVLHELTHGAAYKLLTKEKLTFGITPAAAFCGVPGIYTYRKCALVAILAPLVTWTLILAPVVLILGFTSTLYYIGFSFIFALHIGGCIGDGYLACLLLFKYKQNRILMRDTGPEQFIYSYRKSDFLR